ncbi:MAG: T9SS type A sorting domain-containing protein [Bacteroidota bacterium]
MSGDNSTVSTLGIDPNDVRAFAYKKRKLVLLINTPIQIDERIAGMDVGRAMQAATFAGASNPVGVDADHQDAYWGRDDEGGLFRTWYARERSGTWGQDRDMNLAGPITDPGNPWTETDLTLDADDEVVVMLNSFGLRSEDACEWQGAHTDPACSTPDRRMVVELEQTVDNEVRYLYVDLGRTFGGVTGPRTPTMGSLVTFDYDPEPRFDPTVATPPDTLYPYGYDFGRSSGPLHRLTRDNGDGTFSEIGYCPSGDDLGSNPEMSYIRTSKYDLRIRDRYIVDQLIPRTPFDLFNGCLIQPDGSCTPQNPPPLPDFLDRTRYGLRPDICNRTEFTASANRGSFTVIKSGPVRAIRGSIGFNSGVTTEVTDFFYEGLWVTKQSLRIHPIPSAYLGFDFALPASPSTVVSYSNNLVEGPLSLDGLIAMSESSQLATLDVSSDTGQEGSLYRKGDESIAQGLVWEKFSADRLNMVNAYHVLTDIRSPTERLRNVGVYLEAVNRTHVEPGLDPSEILLCDGTPVQKDANGNYIFDECSGSDAHALHTGLMLLRGRPKKANQPTGKWKFQALPNTDSYNNVPNGGSNSTHTPGVETGNACLPVEVTRYTAIGQAATETLLGYLQNYDLGIDHTTLPACAALPGNSAQQGGTASAQAPAAVERLDLFPNPSLGNSRLELTLNESQAVRIELYDVLGRRISLIHEGELESGLHTFNLADTRSSLGAGTYFVRTRVGSMNNVRKLTILE